MTNMRLNPALVHGATGAKTKVGVLLRYLAAIALVALAHGCRSLCKFDSAVPFWVLFAIVAISTTWICGKGPGWIAVGL
jgi:hypothetical protein